MASVESGITLCAMKLPVPLSKGQTVEPQDDVPFSPKSSVDRQLQAVPRGPSSLVHVVETESGQSQLQKGKNACRAYAGV